jgi:hypothetical protein
LIVLMANYAPTAGIHSRIFQHRAVALNAAKIFQPTGLSLCGDGTATCFGTRHPPSGSGTTKILELLIPSEPGQVDL